MLLAIINVVSPERLGMLLHIDHLLSVLTGLAVRCQPIRRSNPTIKVAYQLGLSTARTLLLTINRGLTPAERMTSTAAISALAPFYLSGIPSKWC
jgi:hypothetical protein